MDQDFLAVIAFLLAVFAMLVYKRTADLTEPETWYAQARSGQSCRNPIPESGVNWTYVAGAIIFVVVLACSFALSLLGGLVGMVAGIFACYLKSLWAWDESES